MLTLLSRLAGSGLIAGTVLASAGAHAAAADLVVTDARVYTAAGAHLASAFAVSGDRIVWVGESAEAASHIGPKTQVKRLGGRFVMPGLVDSHIHPLDILEFDHCDLRSKPMTLKPLAAFVRACLKRYKPAPGEWLHVAQWDMNANHPEPGYPTLRAALDSAAPHNPVELMGNDGHKGAYNSAALALAHDEAGHRFGLSAATLAKEFSAYRDLVGVDDAGEPNGEVNDDARTLLLSGLNMWPDLDKLLAAPWQVSKALNAVGITAILDAAAPPEVLPFYDKLAASGRMTVRASLAQFYDPSHTKRPDGTPDYDRMVDSAVAIRAKYADHPLIRADFIKLFADGVAEGNPFAVPPTLGNAAMLEPYLQPIFAFDAHGVPTVTGYVDTASPECVAARAGNPSPGREEVKAFIAAHGFHPGQCRISNGILQHPREVQLEYVRRMHLKGFNLHIHVIGDRALRTALDAIEAARAADGVSTTRDSLAHIQLTTPEDVARIGRDHLYLAYTYSWAEDRLDYDMTLIPFLQKMHGNGDAERHVPGSPYEENTYPVRTSQAAGGILVAGSDAPVDVRDPRPFVNMAVAVTRRDPGVAAAFNPRQGIPISEAMDAYTINGARFLGREQEIGSIEVGKSADFIVLDRDPLSLAANGHADDIAGTRVLETWFRGHRAYQRPQGRRATAAKAP